MPLPSAYRLVVAVTAALASLLAISGVCMVLLLAASLLRDKRLRGRPSRREGAVRLVLAIALGVALTGWAAGAWFLLTQDLGEDHSSLD